MLLLAADTSGKNGSLALARVATGEHAVEIIEDLALAGGTFSAQLVPQTAMLLEKHGYSKDDLAAFAVASGPGSFTGLRVGLAAIKAMAEILRKPIAAVSLLEAVARSGAAEGRVFALLDAGRGDLYVGDYELGPPVCMHSERLLSREEFSSGSHSRFAITPNQSLADFARDAGCRVEQVGIPAAATSHASVGSIFSGVQRCCLKNLKPITFDGPTRKFSPSRNLEMPVAIRLAVLEDVPVLIAIEQEAPTAAHWTREQYGIRIAGGVVMVAAEEGSPCGFVCAREVAGEWEIENVVVASRVRRRGVADALLLELLRRVCDRCDAVVWLEVRESNHPARRLYEKHGFRESGRRREYYANPVEDAVLYRTG
jgi:ribosomal-protein-alanine N-acetyltransferase